MVTLACILAELTMAMSSSCSISYDGVHKAGQNVSTNNVQPSGVKGSCVGFASLSCNLRNTMRCHEIRRQRGRQVIVASSPPTEEIVIATEPLTKEDLVAYLASGCKPKEKWRCVFQLLLVLDSGCRTCF